MTGALILTAALIGLAGTPHCAAMCGAGCAAVGRSCRPDQPARAVAGLMIGRLVGYAAAGALVASVAVALRVMSEGAGWLRPFWVGLQFFLLFLGLGLLFKGRLPRSIEAWMEQVGGRPQEAAALKKVHLPGELKATGIGLLWPILPCGLLQSALLVAAVASSPLEGAVVMTAFGLTSMLGLVLGPWLWLRFVPSRLNQRDAQGGTLALRLAGAMVAGVSGWTLLHSVLEPLQAWCA